MQLKIFKYYIVNVVKEGNRLQHLDLLGEKTTPNNYTNTQLISIFFSIVFVLLFPKGFTDNFAGYIISFLGIFIGLFASIVISVFDKMKTLINTVNKKTNSEEDTISDIELGRIKKLRNYSVQFTGLTSYSILIALILIGLLSLILLKDGFKTDIYKYKSIEKLSELRRESVFMFLKLSIAITHRLFVVYLLNNFFVITIYSITSYFTFLSSEYKKMKINND